MLLHDKDALLVGRDIAGLPALTQVKQTKPNIVVLDLGIGETESITEISSIKGIDKGIIVVILSTIASVKLRDQCERAGADYFFDKTCEFEKLHGVIHWLNKNQPGAKSA
jgi:DNA-binding NarL/FixJ family response regulator